jgi:hypothetical protein
MLAQNVLFENKIGWHLVYEDGVLFLLILCIDKFESFLDWYGTGKISNFLNKHLHEVLGRAPTIILTVFFVK